MDSDTEINSWCFVLNTSARNCTPNEVLSSGTNKFQEASERMTKDTTASAPSTVKMKVVAPSNGNIFTVGAKRFHCEEVLPTEVFAVPTGWLMGRPVSKIHQLQCKEQFRLVSASRFLFVLLRLWCPLNSDRAEQFRRCFPPYVTTSMPGCQRCHLRLHAQARCFSWQCMLPTLPWRSVYDISSTNEECPIRKTPRFQPLTFKTALSGSGTKCGVARGLWNAVLQ